jgi:hypothetical protein
MKLSGLAGFAIAAVAVPLAILVSGPSVGESGKEYDPPEKYPEAVDQLERPSDLFAAFLVAYEADRLWFKQEKQIDLTPEEFTRRHDRVFITRLEDGRFDIQMGPEALEGNGGTPVRLVNPGRRYIIDAKSLRIIDAFFDR